jgi:hypothetical protein
VPALTAVDRVGQTTGERREEEEAAVGFRAGEETGVVS